MSISSLIWEKTMVVIQNVCSRCSRNRNFNGRWRIASGYDVHEYVCPDCDGRMNVVVRSNPNGSAISTDGRRLRGIQALSDGRDKG